MPYILTTTNDRNKNLFFSVEKNEFQKNYLDATLIGSVERAREIVEQFPSYDIEILNAIDFDKDLAKSLYDFERFYRGRYDN